MRIPSHIARATLAGLVVIIALGVTGCAGDGDDKAGGSGAPVTLRIGHPDPRGYPAGDAIEEFARRVSTLSDGRVRIRPVWQAAGADVTQFDQRVARLVVSGDLDLGMIPARAWDTEGVTTLRALQAPFLISTDELLDAVVTSNLGGDLLGGLEDVGIEGLALIPEELRHPVGFGRGLRSPADFTGVGIDAPLSNTTYALLRALGARPADLTLERAVAAVQAGKVSGAESSFLHLGALPVRGTVTANVVFFPKVNTLVANADRFDELTAEQQEILREAAEQTLRHVVDTRTREVDAAREACRNGAELVMASAADVAALRRAAAPVYAVLERDPTAKELIAAIRALATRKGGSAAAPACTLSQAPPAPGASAGGGAKPTIPEGAYRAEITFEEMVARGVDPTTASTNSGIITLTLDDGRWRGHAQSDRYTGPDCTGRYSYSRRRVTFVADDIPACGTARGLVLFSAVWSVSNDFLRFTQVRSGEGLDLFARVLWGSEPWQKVS
jgi:TRAP-type C4-dicarboxylate transport system substrate-binding protein